MAMINEVLKYIFRCSKMFQDKMAETQNEKVEYDKVAVVYLALYDNNTNMCLTVYLLVYANEVLFTMSVHT